MFRTNNDTLYEIYGTVLAAYRDHYCHRQQQQKQQYLWRRTAATLNIITVAATAAGTITPSPAVMLFYIRDLTCYVTITINLK